MSDKDQLHFLLKESEEQEARTIEDSPDTDRLIGRFEKGGEVWKR